jgi:hypothetical protein
MSTKKLKRAKRRGVEDDEAEVEERRRRSEAAAPSARDSDDDAACTKKVVLLPLCLECLFTGVCSPRGGVLPTDLRGYRLDGRWRTSGCEYARTR